MNIESEEDNVLKIWLDDLMDEKDTNRYLPNGYVGAHSVNEAISIIESAIKNGLPIEEANLDNDLGEYASDGGDGNRLLLYLAEKEIFFPIKIHTSNAVERANMIRTVNRYWPGEYHIG